MNLFYPVLWYLPDYHDGGITTRATLPRYRCCFLPCCNARIPDTPPTMEFPWPPPLMDPPYVLTDPPGPGPACSRLVGTTARLVTVPLTWVAVVDNGGGGNKVWDKGVGGGGVCVRLRS